MLHSSFHWEGGRSSRKTEYSVAISTGQLLVVILFQTAPIWLFLLEPKMVTSIYVVGIHPLSELTQNLTTNYLDGSYRIH